jgi:hypothetical protein
MNVHRFHGFEHDLTVRFLLRFRSMRLSAPNAG